MHNKTRELPLKTVAVPQTHQAPNAYTDTPLMPVPARPAISGLTASEAAALLLKQTTQAAAPDTPRFTVDGDEGLERHLRETCTRIAAGLRGLLPARALEAVLLGGGYGRGEGGVLQTPGGDRPYNDLEFYVCLRGNRHLNERRYGRALHVLGEILTPQAGVDVEFRITSLQELIDSPVTMFSYDLVHGHRWVIGQEALLIRCARHRDAARIPLSEATRLLMNRCTGLLLAQERLARERFTPADADFVGRNIAKAQLGAGDALLTSFRHYHWSVTQRHRRLERLVRTERAAWLSDVYRQHAEGVQFKLHPVRSAQTREELAALHEEVSAVCRDVWLWIENRRLGARFRSIRNYVESRVNKWPARRSLRNLLVNGKVLGSRSVFSRGAFRHPRDRVLTVLPLLLWQPDSVAVPEVLSRVQRALRTRAVTYPDLVAAYRLVWEKVN